MCNVTCVHTNTRGAPNTTHTHKKPEQTHVLLCSLKKTTHHQHHHYHRQKTNVTICTHHPQTEDLVVSSLCRSSRLMLPKTHAPPPQKFFTCQETDWTEIDRNMQTPPPQIYLPRDRLGRDRQKHSDSDPPPSPNLPAKRQTGHRDRQKHSENRNEKKPTPARY